MENISRIEPNPMVGLGDIASQIRLSFMSSIFVTVTANPIEVQIGAHNFWSTMNIRKMFEEKLENYGFKYISKI